MWRRHRRGFAHRHRAAGREDRFKSPDVSAKGRKLDLLAGGDTGRIRTWLRANGYTDRVNTEPQRRFEL